jgi:hypothetical protein
MSSRLFQKIREETDKRNPFFRMRILIKTVIVGVSLATAPKN